MKKNLLIILYLFILLLHAYRGEKSSDYYLPDEYIYSIDRFSLFGNKLMKGPAIYEFEDKSIFLNENYSDYYSKLTKTRYYWDTLRQNVYLNSQSGKLRQRVVIGENTRLRITFSHMTLFKTYLRDGGIFDIGYGRNYTLKGLFIRESDYIYNYGTYGESDGDNNFKSPYATYLMGLSQGIKFNNILDLFRNVDFKIHFVNEYNKVFLENNNYHKFTIWGVPQAKYFDPKIITIHMQQKENTKAPILFYGYKIFLNNKLVKDGSDLSSISHNKTNNYIFSDNTEEIKLTIYLNNFLTNTYDMKNLKIVLLVANNYKILTSQSTVDSVGTTGITFGEIVNPIPTSSAIGDEGYVLQAISSGEVGDGSNKKQIVINYGMPSANSVIGFEYSFNFLGLNIKSEYDINLQSLMYPSPNGEHNNKIIEAYYIKANTSLFDIDFSGNVYYMPNNYKTKMDTLFNNASNGNYSYSEYMSSYPYVKNWVDDDDNHNDKDDLLEKFGNASIADLNFNGLNDYEEDFLLYKNDNPFFLIGNDKNNNSLIDIYENDNLPDYPYPPGHIGQELIMMYYLPFSSGSYVSYNYYYSKLDSFKNSDLFNKFTLQYKININDFNIGINYKKKIVNDDIPDNMLNPGYQTDNLKYKSSIVDTLQFNIGITSIENLNLTTVLKFDNNKQLTNNNLDIKYPRTYLDEGILIKSDYKYYILNNLSLLPAFKYSFIRNSIFENNNFERSGNINYALLAFLKWNVVKNSTLTIGYQFLSKTYLYNSVDKQGNFNKHSFGIEYIIKGRSYKRLPVSIQIGYYMYDKYFINKANSEYKENNFYIKAWYGR